MQVDRRTPAQHGRWLLWLPVWASLAAYVTLALLVITSDAGARGRRVHRAPTVKFVEQNGVVQGGSVAAFAARCPASAPHAVGPEFAPLSVGDEGQVTVAGSYPSGANGWTVVVKNLSVQPRGYFAGVVCVGAPGARFAFTQASGVAQPQQEDVEGVRCPRNAPNPVGSSFRLQPGSAPGSAVVDQAWPGADNRGRLSGTQWGGMRNLTATPVGVFIGASCTSLRVDPNANSFTVPPGKVDGSPGRCTRRGESAAGGMFFAKATADEPVLALDAVFHARRGQWSTAVINLSTHPVPYVVGTVCIG